MHVDIPWSDDGGHVPGADRVSHEPGDALEFYSYLLELKRRGLLGGIGIIHDGTPKDDTDAAWTQDARQHVLLIEGKQGLHPVQDISVLVPHPSRALEESSPDTLTGLVNWFIREAEK